MQFDCFHIGRQPSINFGLLSQSAIFGLGTPLSTLAALLYFTNVPTWVWHSTFRAGVAFMALA
jgi:hypothetical protein